MQSLDVALQARQNYVCQEQQADKVRPESNDAIDEEVLVVNGVDAKVDEPLGARDQVHATTCRFGVEHKLGAPVKLIHHQHLPVSTERVRFTEKQSRGTTQPQHNHTSDK